MAKRKSLTDAELARKSGKKKAHEIIYIIPEGQTEYAYFTAIKNHFRKTNLHIEVAKANTDTDPRQIANRAILARKSNADYTHIACVLDADNPTALAEARASVKRIKPINFIPQNHALRFGCYCTLQQQMRLLKIVLPLKPGYGLTGKALSKV